MNDSMSFEVPGYEAYPDIYHKTLKLKDGFFVDIVLKPTENFCDANLGNDECTEIVTIWSVQLKQMEEVYGSIPEGIKQLLDNTLKRNIALYTEEYIV